MDWLRDANMKHKQLAVDLCGIFVSAEKEKFEFRLKDLLPQLVTILEPRTDETENRELDLLLIKTHFTLIKITHHCAVGMRKADIVDITEELWNRIIHHMLHPHVWVRIHSAKLISTLLGWHKVDELGAYIANPSEEIPRTYLTCPESAARLRSLASVSVSQLQPGFLNNQLADLVVKNLVYIAKVANRIAPSDGEREKESLTSTSAPTLPWLIAKLRREIHSEVALRPTIPIKVCSIIICNNDHLIGTFYPHQIASFCLYLDGSYID